MDNNNNDLTWLGNRKEMLVKMAVQSKLFCFWDTPNSVIWGVTTEKRSVKKETKVVLVVLIIYVIVMIAHLNVRHFLP